MTRRATLHDVAGRAGVSIKTVSRVVNGADSVSDEIRSRVTAAITELQYVPNSFARSLKAGSGDTIGVIIDTLSDPFFAALASAIEDRAVTAGLNVVIGSTGFAADRERSQVERMAMQRVEALVLTPVDGSHLYLEQFRGAFPIVLVDRAFDIEGFDLVAVDDEGVSRQAVDHLIAHGHRRIAFVGSDERYPTTTARLRGYYASMHAAG
ncbi:MAG TPA: LacI family DNA-binding transcriptional regulator, partial [Marmoricola sp.]